MDAYGRAGFSAASAATTANPHLEEARRLAAQVNKRLEAEVDLDAAEKTVLGFKRAVRDIKQAVQDVEAKLLALKKELHSLGVKLLAKEGELRAAEHLRDERLAICQKLRDLTQSTWSIASAPSQPDAAAQPQERYTAEGRSHSAEAPASAVTMPEGSGPSPAPAPGDDNAMRAAAEAAAEASAAATLLGISGGVPQAGDAGPSPLPHPGITFDADPPSAASPGSVSPEPRVRAVDAPLDGAGAAETSPSGRHVPPTSAEHAGADGPDLKHYLEYDAAKAATEDVMVVRRRGTSQWKVVPPGKGETMFYKDPMCSRLAPYAKPVGPASWFILRTYPGKNMVKWSSSSVKAGVKGVAALRRHLLGPPVQADGVANGSAGGQGKGSKRRGGADSEPAASPDVHVQIDGHDDGGGKRRKVASMIDPSPISPAPGKGTAAEPLGRRSVTAAAARKDAASDSLPELEAALVARLAAIPTYKVLSVKGVNFSVLPQGVKAVKGGGAVEPIAVWAARCAAEHPDIVWDRDLLVNGQGFGETDIYKSYKT